MRAVAGDLDAVMPANGPDRYKDIVTELIKIPTRDGAKIELKVYRSTKVNHEAVLMYRMHGGKWCIGRHEVDGVDNVYAATNPDIVVVSVDYRLWVLVREHYDRKTNGTRAPENPFPTQINDCHDGLIWVRSIEIEEAYRLTISSAKTTPKGWESTPNVLSSAAVQPEVNSPLLSLSSVKRRRLLVSSHRFSTSFHHVIPNSSPETSTNMAATSRTTMTASSIH